MYTRYYKRVNTKWPFCDNGVFHVFHVNRYVNIVLLNRNFFLCNKNMLTDLLTWNTWKTPLRSQFQELIWNSNYGMSVSNLFKIKPHHLFLYYGWHCIWEMNLRQFRVPRNDVIHFKFASSIYQKFLTNWVQGFIIGMCSSKKSLGFWATENKKISHYQSKNGVLAY